jgi:hypothetical protein
LTRPPLSRSLVDSVIHGGGRSLGRSLTVGSVASAVVAGALVATPVASAAPEDEPTVSAVEVTSGPFGLQAADLASAAAVAQEKGQRVEVLAERTESSSTWVLPDGKLSTSFAAGPIWVRQGGDGAQAEDWAPVDLTLKAGDDGAVRPKAHPGDLVLDGGGAADNGLLLSMSRSEGESLGLAWEGTLPTPRLEGPRATYPQVQPGVDLVVEATRTGYEQFFVLTDAPAPGAEPELSLTVQTEGLTAKAAADGAVVFTDGEGDVVAGTGTPHTWDAAVDAERLHPLTQPWTSAVHAPAVLGPLPEGESSLQTDPAPAAAPGEESAELPSASAEAAPAAAELGQEGSPAEVQAKASPLLPLTGAADVTAPDAVEFTLSPDEAYLQDTDTAYPVVVDPDVTLDGWFDTWVQTGVTTDQSGSPELRIGTYNIGSDVARSFLNVHMEYLKHKIIFNADLLLWNWHSWSCESRGWEVWATGVAGTSTRATSQPTWVDRWGYSTQTRGYSGCAEGWVGADVTNLVQAWSSNGREVVGMGLKANNETSNLGWKKFNSGNYAGGGIPHINITYDGNCDRYQGKDICGEIRSKYYALGGWDGPLGVPTISYAATPTKPGAYQNFANGSIYWSSTTGAHVLYNGAMRDRWAAQGSENGALGFPTIDQSSVSGGERVDFEGGSIYWSATTGARVVSGAIREKWAAVGGHEGVLGFPKTDTTAISGGAYADFVGGSIYANPDLGNHVMSGSLYDKWSSLGGAGGYLGYPVSDPYGTSVGLKQNFANGQLVKTTDGGIHECTMMDIEEATASVDSTSPCRLADIVASDITDDGPYSPADESGELSPPDSRDAEAGGASAATLTDEDSTVFVPYSEETTAEGSGEATVAAAPRYPSGCGLWVIAFKEYPYMKGSGMSSCIYITPVYHRVHTWLYRYRWYGLEELDWDPSVARYAWSVTSTSRRYCVGFGTYTYRTVGDGYLTSSSGKSYTGRAYDEAKRTC